VFEEFILEAEVKVINEGKLPCTTPPFVATSEVNVFTFVATQSTGAGLD
jgi:hypothetical protein